MNDLYMKIWNYLQINGKIKAQHIATKRHHMKELLQPTSKKLASINKYEDK